MCIRDSSYPLAHLGLHTPVSVYAGLLALAANLMVAVVLTLVFRWTGVRPGPDATEPWHYVADEDDLTISRLAELIDGQQPYQGRHIREGKPAIVKLPVPAQRDEEPELEARGPFEPARPAAGSRAELPPEMRDLPVRSTDPGSPFGGVPGR